jgi:hypothetical protein
MAGKKTVPLPIRWRDTVTEHPNINSVEWAVAMALSMRMDNKSGECYPGFSSLGRVTRLSRSSVKRAVKGLEAKGLLRVRRRRIAANYNETNFYTAQFPKAQADLPRACPDLPGSPAHTDLGPAGTPVSSETQGEKASDQDHVEAPGGAGPVRDQARLERKSDLPPRLRNLPPDHPAVVEHRRVESERLAEETDRLFGQGPTSDELDKEQPRG